MIRKTYIESSTQYDFLLKPCPNPFAMNDHDNTELKKKGTRTDVNVKWAMITVSNNMGASDLKKKDRDQLFKAVILTQSYLQGCDRPVFSVKYFSKSYTKFKLCARNRPDLLADVFVPRSSKKKQSYIDMLGNLFPTLLHSLYRYGINVLGPSARTESLVHIMNRKSKTLYPDCPIRSNLSLNNFIFGDFLKNLMED